MAKERFTSKLTNRLLSITVAESEASRRREQAAAGLSIYRDRRDVRLPFYRMRINQKRKLYIAFGLLWAIVVHAVFGINLTFCAIAFGACGFLIFEWKRRQREKWEQHFD
ncbi:MAG: hypothetical protein KJ670_00655 [Alphaproteobacteria bacterium]|jgi:hypothetical protein|nr:hypothetical protein [Rhizobiaceae bacterium]MBC7148397.1 hypothetical protein [Rhizobium sp.]MBU3959854.1 hypothetical protein [Alphaproteobacteria bacterium]MBU4050833.1 hypothetical protein [Alphaproteobacteria bacterium]MBU4087208.1 hypothetical protein [Alphaproteobacteria bacterium]